MPTKKTASSCEDNIKVSVKVAECETVNLIQPVQEGLHDGLFLVR